MKHNHVGIDVSAKTFTAIIDHDGERSEAFDLTDRLLSGAARRRAGYFNNG